MFQLGTRYGKMVWKIGCNRLASWCIRRFQCIMTLEKCGGSSFTHYTTNVAPNYKNIFFAKWGNHIKQYMLESIWLVFIWMIASIRLYSHSLRGEAYPLPLITFSYAFHTSSNKPNLCMNLCHGHNVHTHIGMCVQISTTRRTFIFEVLHEYSWFLNHTITPSSTFVW